MPLDAHGLGAVTPQDGDVTVGAILKINQVDARGSGRIAFPLATRADSAWHISSANKEAVAADSVQPKWPCPVL